MRKQRTSKKPGEIDSYKFELLKIWYNNITINVQSFSWKLSVRKFTSTRRFFNLTNIFLTNRQKMLKDEVWKIMLAKTFDCSRKWVIVSWERLHWYCQMGERTHSLIIKFFLPFPLLFLFLFNFETLLKLSNGGQNPFLNH